MPNVVVNPQLIAKGPFGPELIGPFTEFGFTVDVRSITDVPKEREAAATP